MSNVFHWPSGILSRSGNSNDTLNEEPRLSECVDLIECNHQWAEEVKHNKPELIKQISAGQSPKYLWIGCADSRVAPTEIIPKFGLGDVFVHRNIANVVLHTDMNLLSVVEYAVGHLHVEHIIVCGHYGCGGVLGAMGHDQLGLIDNWLRNIKDVYNAHYEEISKLEGDEKVDRLVELNVRRGVFNLANTTIVQNAWREGRSLTISGFVFNLKDARLSDLKITVGGLTDVDDVYKYKKAGGH